MQHLRFASLAAFGALLLAAPAHATAEFPGLIVSHLNITCDGGANPIWDGNGCTICHTSNNGGLGTVQHPFGENLKAEGLSAFNDTELTKLLDQEKTAMHDFNCDGIPDIVELESCEWPQLTMLDTTCGGGGDAGMEDDSGTPSGAPPETVVYGCSTSNAAQGSGLPAGVAVSVAGLLGVALIRRRIKARTQSR